MKLEWTEITDAIRSGDSEQVNDALDQIGEPSPDERLNVFDTGFDDLASIYAESDDGYVRQSVVRAVDEVSPGLAVVVMLADEEGSTRETESRVKQRLDTATGFLLEALQDDDGRVRQSAKRALKDAYRGYEALEETETIAALASELDALADEYDDKRHDHLLESKADAEFFLTPRGNRMIESIRQFAESQDSLDPE